MQLVLLGDKKNIKTKYQTLVVLLFLSFALG